MALIISLLLNVILFVVLLFMTRYTPQPVYFATSNSGRLVKIQPRSEPIMTNSAILSWVSESVPQIYSLDFINYRAQLNASRKYFTNYGWGQFLNAFAPNLKKIKQQRLVASAAPTGVPVIVKEGVLNGVYSWQIQIPMLVSFQKGSTAETQKVVWSIIVQRVNNQNTNQLLGISQIVQTVQNQS